MIVTGVYEEGVPTLLEQVGVGVVEFATKGNADTVHGYHDEPPEFRLGPMEGV
jgi:hypothetical protein